MLPERITELLSAYVDGELSARERRNVTRILRKSNEARQMLHKLKQDSMILRKMPRRKTQLDLSGSVMGTISLRGITLPKIETVPVPPPPPARRRWRFGVGIAIAALLLVAIGAASYLAFRAAFRSPETPVTPGTGRVPGTAAGTRSPAIPEKPLPVLGLVHEPETPEPAPKGVDPQRDDRFGLGWTRPPAFVIAQPRLMLIQSVRDLDQPGPGQALLNELRKDDSSRLDLFCTDTAVALERLSATFKAYGVALRLDPFAQVRLKDQQRGKSKTNYAIYCRDLSPEAWTLLVQQLAAEDKKAPARQFDKLTVNSLTPAELVKVLGGEPAYYEPPEGTGPLRIDIRQDISAQTANQLTQGPPRPEPDGIDKGMPTRHAVAVPYLPQPGFSREVRYIVESKSWRPGAVQALLVLWNP
jgi:hypothetical protein